MVDDLRNKDAVLEIFEAAEYIKNGSFTFYAEVHESRIFYLRIERPPLNYELGTGQANENN